MRFLFTWMSGIEVKNTACYRSTAILSPWGWSVHGRERTAAGAI